MRPKTTVEPLLRFRRGGEQQVPEQAGFLELLLSDHLPELLQEVPKLPKQIAGTFWCFSEVPKFVSQVIQQVRQATNDLTACVTDMFKSRPLP